MTTILLRGTDKWNSLPRREYGNEDELQKLLRESPEIIPASSPDVATAYCREFPTAAGPVDLLGIDSQGRISLIECKLARNQDVKRKVVGQLLDYAAALYMTQLPDLETTFTLLEKTGPFEVLRELSDASWNETSCRQLASRNLERGAFRLLVAVDEANEGLRRIIQYVNAKPGSLRLAALAFPFYTDGSAQVLVPEVYGDELAEAKVTESPASVEDALADQPEGLRQLHDVLAQFLSPQLTKQGESITYKGADGRTSLYVRLVPDYRIWLQDAEPLGVPRTTWQEAATAAGFDVGGTWVQRPENVQEAAALIDAWRPLLPRARDTDNE